jgi:phage terminase small subunit
LLATRHPFNTSDERENHEYAVSFTYNIYVTAVVLYKKEGRNVGRKKKGRKKKGRMKEGRK